MRRVAGIDVGGTFTDLLMQEADGTVRLSKVPTTPNQADGVLAAIEAAGGDPALLDLIIHGTTATTNAVDRPSREMTADRGITGSFSSPLLRRPEANMPGRRSASLLSTFASATTSRVVDLTEAPTKASVPVNFRSG